MLKARSAATAIDSRLHKDFERPLLPPVTTACAQQLILETPKGTKTARRKFLPAFTHRGLAAYRCLLRTEKPSIATPTVSTISISDAQPLSVGTGTLTTGTATGAKTADTVHAATTAPVTNGLAVVVAPPQPLILISVKPAFAAAVQVAALPNGTGFGEQFTVPPLAAIEMVVSGTEISTKFAVTVQALVMGPVTYGLVDDPAPPQPLMPPAAGLIALTEPGADADATNGAST